VRSALAFWLRAVESRGGLADPSGDTALVMLPWQLQELFDLPAELEVTDDPDVARTDGVAFLGVGHPAIARAADILLADADVGVIDLATANRVPDLAALQDKARQRFPIGHGRIDLVGPPQPDRIAIVRLGALIRYVLSDEDHYQEDLEQWVDATTCLPVGAAIGDRLLSAPREAVDPDLRPVSVAEAVSTAYHQIDAAAARRRMELAKELAAACRDELARAEAYYAAALESIAKRRATAPAERHAMLDARAESTRAERARRLEEIAEKYRGSHETQPFRLHLLRVPALRLQGEVRRGDRRYPLTLTWLPVAGEFMPVRCPTCARHAPLDAGKTELGCISCHTKAKAVPPQPPTPSATQPTPPVAAATRPAQPPAAPRLSTPRLPTQHAAQILRRSGRPKVFAGKQLAEAGSRLAVALWRAHVEDDGRSIKRLAAPDSPMATAYRLFRSQAPAVSVGMPAEALPQEITTYSYPHPSAGRYVTEVEVSAAGEAHPHAIVWRDDGHQRQILRLAPQHPLRTRLFERCPAPVDTLDEVAATIWRATTPRLGLPTALRVLTAWWRWPDPAALLQRFGPVVIAAALERAVCYWGGGGPGGYDQAAQAYEVPVDEVRKAGPVLQRALKLTPEQPW
jgi:hypothetical protein